MKKIQSERGSVTVFIILSFIFCMTMLMSMYMSATNRQTAVIQAEQIIREAYEKDVKNMDKIRNKL